MGTVNEKSLPLAIALNFFLPGLGYIYMGKWIVGIAAFLLVVGMYLGTGLLFLIPTWIGLNIIMLIDMLILSNKNKAQVIKQNMKKCPNCAELVQKEAKVCRYCNTKFDATTATPLSPIAGEQITADMTTPTAPDANPTTSPAASAMLSTANVITAVVVVGVIAVGLMLTNRKSNTNPTASAAAPRATTEESPKQKAPETAFAPLGTTLTNKRFEVTLKGASMESALYSGESFGNISVSKAESDMMFAVLSVTVKCVDTESRFYLPGALYVQHEGKEYMFDKQEIVIGSNLIMEQINPLTTASGRVIFKVPKTLATAHMSWQPIASATGTRFLVQQEKIAQSKPEATSASSSVASEATSGSIKDPNYGKSNIELAESSYKEADAELNRYWKVLMSRLSTEERNQLRQQQLGWIKERDKACQGQQKKDAEYECLSAQTEQRTDELKKRYGS